MRNLEADKNKAYQKYQDALSKLAESPTAAQEANDAWLEFKKLDKEINNRAIFKKLGDLYGCEV